MQKRLAQNIAETSSQGYVNIKAMHQKFKEDQEKYATDLLNYQEEINQLKINGKRKVTSRELPIAIIKNQWLNKR
jgi:flagellar basal body rod protein FlgF